MLAIIIPYYKLTYFDATLESLARQTDKRFKVYIGDDASLENPEELLIQYKEQFEFIYHRFETNLGSTSLTQQWERCIALSEKEEWLMVLGDDDYLSDNVVEELNYFISKNKNLKIDLVRFNLKIIDGFGNLSVNTFDYEVYESSERLLKRMLTHNETITASEFVFNRSVYKKNQGFVELPLAWFSDYASWLLYAKDAGVINISSASVYWRLSDINISSQSANLKETNLKVKSLFLFMFFVAENFKITKNIENGFITNHLNYVFYHIKFSDICKILGKQLLKNHFKFALIIIVFILNRILKKISKI